MFSFFKPFQNDFYWDYSDEPHASRRKQILGNLEQTITHSFIIN